MERKMDRILGFYQKYYVTPCIEYMPLQHLARLNGHPKSLDGVSVL